MSCVNKTGKHRCSKKEIHVRPSKNITVYADSHFKQSFSGVVLLCMSRILNYFLYFSLMICIYCVVYKCFVCLCAVSTLKCLVLPVSLDCPVLVFSNVYLQ